MFLAEGTTEVIVQEVDLSGSSLASGAEALSTSKQALSEPSGCVPSMGSPLETLRGSPTLPPQQLTL